jgi:two-component system heavy metal sensor histidine kinase CusS
MSSKNALDMAGEARPSDPRKRAWSLATRLTAWYIGSSFALVLAATGFLYWASARNLDREDDQLLGDRVRALRTVMQSRPGSTAAIRQEVEEEWEAHERTRVHMRVMDEGGEILAETPGMSGLLPSASFPASAAEPGRGADLDSTGGKSFRVLAVDAPGGSPGRPAKVIQVAMDRSLERELDADYRKNLFLVLGAALAVCAVVGYQIARRGIRPIHQITATACRIRPTTLSERITPDGLPAELLMLADTFNRMLDRLEESFARLSRFSADIAHELRTPVSSLRGEVEVALSKSRTPEEYREVLGSNLEECGRLAHMIDRLLFLARAENPETQINKEPCDVARELAKVCEFFGLPAAEAGVRLTVVAGHEMHADLDRPLFQRAVSNLVANSLAHTPAGGTVTLATTGDDTSIRVEVADTGCGIPPEHLPHVFERFYRADPTRSSPNGGVGLGLAIVRSIMELHGGTVEIVSAVGRGTRATLSFPRKDPCASLPGDKTVCPTDRMKNS